MDIIMSNLNIVFEDTKNEESFIQIINIYWATIYTLLLSRRPHCSHETREIIFHRLFKYLTRLIGHKHKKLYWKDWNESGHRSKRNELYILWIGMRRGEQLVIE